MNIPKWFWLLAIIVFVLLMIFIIVKLVRSKKEKYITLERKVKNQLECGDVSGVIFNSLPPPPGRPPYVVDTRTKFQLFMDDILPAIINIVKNIADVVSVVLDNASAIGDILKKVKSGVTSFYKAMKATDFTSTIENLIDDFGTMFGLGMQFVGDVITSPISSSWSGIKLLWSRLTKIFDFFKNINLEFIKDSFHHVKDLVENAIDVVNIAKGGKDIYDKIKSPVMNIGIGLQSILRKKNIIQYSLKNGQFICAYLDFFSNVQQKLSNKDVDIKNVLDSYTHAANYYIPFWSGSLNSIRDLLTVNNITYSTNDLDDLYYNISTPFEQLTIPDPTNFSSSFLDHQQRQNIYNNYVYPTGSGESQQTIKTVIQTLDNVFNSDTDPGSSGGVPFTFFSDCIKLCEMIYQSECIYNIDLFSVNSDEFMLANEENSNIHDFSLFYKDRMASIEGYISKLLAFMFCDPKRCIQLSNGIRAIYIPHASTIRKGGFTSCCNDTNNEVCGEVNNDNNKAFVITENSMATFCGARVSDQTDSQVVACNLYYQYCDASSVSNCDVIRGTPPNNLTICSMVPLNSLRTFFLNPNTESYNESTTGSLAIIDAEYCPQRLYLKTVNFPNSNIIGASAYAYSTDGITELVNDYFNSMFYLMRCKDLINSLGNPFTFLLNMKNTSQNFFPTKETVLESSSYVSFQDLLASFKNPPIDVTGLGGTTYKVIFDQKIGSGKPTSFLGTVIPTKIGDYDITFNTNTDVFKQGNIQNSFLRYRQNINANISIKKAYSPCAYLSMVKTFSNCPKLGVAIGDKNPFITFNSDYNIDLNLYNMISIPTRKSYLGEQVKDIPVVNDIDKFYEYIDDDIIYTNFHFSMTGLSGLPLLYLNVWNKLQNLLEPQIYVPGVVFYSRQINVQDPYLNVNLNCSENPDGSYTSSYLNDYPGYVASYRDGLLLTSQVHDRMHDMSCNTINFFSVDMPINWVSDTMRSGNTLDNFFICGNFLHLNSDKFNSVPLDISQNQCGCSGLINLSIYDNEHMYQIDFTSGGIYLQSGQLVSVDISNYIKYYDPGYTQLFDFNIPINDLFAEIITENVVLNHLGLEMYYDISTCKLNFLAHDGNPGQQVGYNINGTFIISKYIMFPFPTNVIKYNEFYLTGPQVLPTSKTTDVFDQTKCYCWQLTPKSVNVVLTIKNVINIGHCTPNSLDDIINFGDPIGCLPYGFPLPIKSIIAQTNYRGVVDTDNNIIDLPIFVMIDANGFIYLYKAMYSFNGMINQVYNNITINISYVTSTVNEYIIYSPFNNNTNIDNYSNLTIVNSVENSIPGELDQQKMPVIYTVYSTKIFLDLYCKSKTTTNDLSNILKLIPFNRQTNFLSSSFNNNGDLYFDCYIDKQNLITQKLTIDQYGNYSLDIPSSFMCQGIAKHIYIQTRINSCSNPLNKPETNLSTLAPSSCTNNIDYSTYFYAGSFIPITMDLSFNDITCFPNDSDAHDPANTYLISFINDSTCLIDNTYNKKLAVPVSILSDNTYYLAEILIKNLLHSTDNKTYITFSLFSDAFNKTGDKVKSFTLNTYFIFSAFLGCTVFRNSLDVFPNCDYPTCNN